MRTIQSSSHQKTGAGKFCAAFQLLLQLFLGPANPSQLLQTWRQLFQAFAAFFSRFQMVWQCVRWTWLNQGLKLCLSYWNNLIDCHQEADMVRLADHSSPKTDDNDFQGECWWGT